MEQGSHPIKTEFGLSEAELQPADDPDNSDRGSGPELRGAPRFALLLRPAKLICGEAEYFCLIRDISSSGVRVKLFHPLPDGKPHLLELRNGKKYELNFAWAEDSAAGFSFIEPVEIDELIDEAGEFPKRQLRLKMSLPVYLRTGDKIVRAEAHNLSQQGARVDCNEYFKIDQLVMLSIGDLPEIQTKVRWRRRGRYGLLFEDTFPLRDFAVLAESLQR
jgi:hypothetical protein